MPSLPAELETWIPSVVQEWRRWLAAHYARFASQHDDLIQGTSVDLIEWVTLQHPGMLSEQSLRHVGFSILHRRIADLFRKQVRDWWEVPAEEHSAELEALADPRVEASPEAMLERARLLRVLISIVAELSPEDRELVFGSELGEDVDPQALSPAERKRASRLRARLRDLVEARLQSDHYKKGT